jgi:hypothetical protein
LIKKISGFRVPVYKKKLSCVTSQVAIMKDDEDIA